MLFAVAAAVLYALLINLLHLPCPVRWLAGVPCPTCGMTRSALCLLTLNFKGAFYYHPLTILMPFVFFLAYRSKRTRLTNVLLVLLAVLFFVTYIVRLLSNAIPA